MIVFALTIAEGIDDLSRNETIEAVLQAPSLFQSWEGSNNATLEYLRELYVDLEAEMDPPAKIDWTINDLTWDYFDEPMGLNLRITQIEVEAS